MEVYDSPRTIFQEKIEGIFKKEEEASEVFSNIFKLQQVSLIERATQGREDPNQWRVLLELYTTLGPTIFANIVSICDGRTISFPTEPEFEDQILTTLCYYYKEVDGLDWKDVKDRLGIPKLNTIKYGIKVRQLKSFIDTQLFSKLEKIGLKDLKERDERK